jgi:hypothetical protein
MFQLDIFCRFFFLAEYLKVFEFLLGTDFFSTVKVSKDCMSTLLQPFGKV